MRAIVLTGTGKAFCAGGDIRAMKDPEGRKAPAVRARMQSAHAWARALLDCDKPVIAAVNGAAVGGGLALALLADIVIASRDAYFMSGYSKLGALPDLGLLQTLPWAIGSLRAKEMIMLNRRYTAEEAVAIGLANRAVAPEKLMSEALAAAEEIASGPAAMLTMSKVMMKRAYEASVEDFFEREAISQAIAFGSAEFSEGVDAFLSKRKPRFNGGRRGGRTGDGRARDEDCSPPPHGSRAPPSGSGVEAVQGLRVQYHDAFELWIGPAEWPCSGRSLGRERGRRRSPGLLSHDGSSSDMLLSPVRTNPPKHGEHAGERRRRQWHDGCLPPPVRTYPARHEGSQEPHHAGGHHRKPRGSQPRGRTAGRSTAR